jgi:hypothetical protein
LAHDLQLDDHAGLLHPAPQGRGGGPAVLVTWRGHAPAVVTSSAARAAARPVVVLQWRDVAGSASSG